MLQLWTLRMLKIYTKTGDKGKTSLFDGTRVYKNNPRVEAFGTIDELNSVIGIVVSEIHAFPINEKFKDTLIKIQNNLFEIGAILANPSQKEHIDIMQHIEKHTKGLENYVDELTIEMPELTHFILPGGGRV